MQIKSFKEIFGGGYKSFIESRHRYRVLIGSRASKKSATTSLDYIMKLEELQGSNLLVIRKVFKDHRDSTYTQLKWAINHLGLGDRWDAKVNPFEINHNVDGRKILFRGLDDPQSITSITSSVGHINFVWFEEAFQITKEEDFNLVDESIRGMMPENLYKQLTLTMNPWNEKHWIKKKFWDTDDPDVFKLQTNYMCNEFLDEKDKRLFEIMKEKNPRRYWVAGLGNWGQAEGLIFNNWEEKLFDYQDILRERGAEVRAVFGLDWGYTNDPTGFIASLIDVERREIWVFDEFYEYGMSNVKIAREIQIHGFGGEKIIADRNEPKSIAELKKEGIHRVRAARGGNDSIRNGIQFLLEFKIYVHPKCKWTNYELNNYAWEEKDGRKGTEPIPDFNHLIDPLRYSVEEFSRASSIRFFKSRKI